eukprot:362555-Chlamydomonas_euryale.AAC.16
MHPHLRMHSHAHMRSCAHAGVAGAAAAAAAGLRTPSPRKCPWDGQRALPMCACRATEEQRQHQRCTLLHQTPPHPAPPGHSPTGAIPLRLP